MRNDGQDRLVQLDGLRGVAAILVMLYHVNNLFGYATTFSRCYLFVDFFFLLSGFVLTLAIEPKFAQGLTTTAFMKARIRRLWPLMALGAVLGAATISPAHVSSSIVLALLLALTMIPLRGSWQTEIFPLNGPQWSIFFELLANFAHALTLHRSPAGRIFLGVVLAGTLLSGAIWAAGSNTMGPTSGNWFVGLPRVTFSYGLGILLGRSWRSGHARMPCPWWAPFGLIAIAPLAAAALEPWLSVAVGDIIGVLLVFPALFWLAACNTPPHRVMPVLRSLGALSFPLYAVHLPLLRMAQGIERSPRSAVVAMAVCLAVAGLLAMITPFAHRLIRVRRPGFGRHAPPAHT